MKQYFAGLDTECLEPPGLKTSPGTVAIRQARLIKCLKGFSIGLRHLVIFTTMDAPMITASPHRLITDELLALSVGIKQEAGVSHAPIQEVIDRFASQEQWNERTGGIGFPLVEDIPQARRGEFMVVLAALVAEKSRPLNSRTLSATQIWPSRII